ncbi:MAG: Transmembrane component NikQ of energizing module of nickel ECF transporter, partial [uncultured Actinomycetospora sp.]
GGRARPPALPRRGLGGPPPARAREDRRRVRVRPRRGGHAARGVRGVRAAVPAAGRRVDRGAHPAGVARGAGADRGAVRRARRPAAVLRRRPARRVVGDVAVGRRPARRVEHPGQGHARRPGVRDARGHHAAARPRLGALAAAGAGDGLRDRDADAALPRGHRRRGPPDAPGADLPRARPPVRLAARGDGALGRRAVPAVLRARRARAPGDALARLHRHHARLHHGVGVHRDVGRGAAARGRRGAVRGVRILGLV